MHTPPAILLTIVIALCVVGLLVGAAVLVAVAKSIGKDRGIAGCLAGCLGAMAIAAMLMVGGIIAGVVLLASLRREPAELHWVPLPEPDVEAGDVVHLRFTVNGQLGRELVELVERILGEGAELEVRRGWTRFPKEYAVYDFSHTLGDRQLLELKAEIEIELELLRSRLPEGVEVEFEGAEVEEGEIPLERLR